MSDDPPDPRNVERRSLWQAVPTRLARGWRRSVRKWRWAPQFRRLQELRGIGDGRRAFLVGSGPSLNEMDLGLLRHDFVCVANMAVRAIGHGLDHADMHVMNDTHGYLRFSHEIEEIARRHSIPYRFLNIRARSIWQKLPERGAEPIFIVPHTEKLLSVGAVPPIVEGIASGGSVLISAAIVLRHLGFDPIYVIGCDLDYETRGKYFYRAGANDISHENDPVVQRRRAGMSEVNGQFEVLRRDFLRRGNEILNAGVGGNLNALPRVCFASLFPGETRDGG